MKKEDLTIGQEVFIHGVNFRPNRLPEKGVIEKIGRKYVTIAWGGYMHMQFEYVDNQTETGNYRHHWWRTIEQEAADLQRQADIKILKDHGFELETYRTKPTDENLRRVAALLNGENE